MSLFSFFKKKEKEEVSVKFEIMIDGFIKIDVVWLKPIDEIDVLPIANSVANLFLLVNLNNHLITSLEQAIVTYGVKTEKNFGRMIADNSIHLGRGLIQQRLAENRQNNKDKVVVPANRTLMP